MAKLDSRISRLARRFRRAVQRHGIFGLHMVAAQRMGRLITGLWPSVRVQLLAREQRAAAFDREFCVDTAGSVDQASLNVNNPNQVHAAGYRGSDPELFRKTIGGLPIDYRRFVFIDFGSGKGRAILLATGYPFKKIVGVEFSEELHVIAQENIRRLRRVTSGCSSVESFCMDATAFALPDDCLVCYFYNPFGAAVMSRVVSNIRKSLLQKPRDIFIVYCNPREGHVVDQAGCFSRVAMNNSMVIWKSTLKSQASGEGQYLPRNTFSESRQSSVCRTGP